MLKRQEWAKIIRRNDKAKIHKMNKRLFQNMDETLEFARGYFDFAAELAKKGENPRTALMERVRKINIAMRNAFLELPLEKAAIGIHRLNGTFGSLTTSTLIGSTMANEGEAGIQFLTKLIAIMFASYDEPKMSEAYSAAGNVLYYTIVESGASDSNMRTWENALRYLQTSGNIDFLHSLNEVAHQRKISLSVISYSEWRSANNLNIILGAATRTTFPLPTPDDLKPWLSEVIKNVCREYKERDDRLHKILDRFENNYERHRAHYSDMWLEMMLDPHYALRPDGHDWVNIAIPEIRERGYKRFVFFPQTDFPSFRVQVVIDKYGHHIIRESAAAPADLPVMDDALRKTTDRRFLLGFFLGYLIVRCVWRIVMGKEPEASGAGQSNGGGEGGGEGGGAAIVRPFFRKLPEGFRMSAEARERALATFQTEPPPGFTFVRGYRRGDEPHSGEPLWSLSEDDLTLPS